MAAPAGSPGSATKGMDFMKNLSKFIALASSLLAIMLAASVAHAQQPGMESLVENTQQLLPEEGPRSQAGRGSKVGDEVLVQYDPETGSLIIITDEETNESINEVVKALDTPVPQVLIKVIFLEVTHSDDVDLGLEFSAQDVDDHLGVVQSGTDAEGNPSFSTSNIVDRTDTLETLFGLGSETTGGFYRLVKDDLSVTLRALSQVAELEVLSRPSILTRNNQEAVITVGQEVPFIRNTRILQDGQQLNTVEYEDIGIILRVTPQIRKDGLVAMDVTPEISTLTGETVPIAANVSAPIFAKRSAETAVVVPDGETVVIGGLMEDQKTEAIRQVPGLARIPVLGNLFRRKITNKAKTELLIFLTPHIVQSPYALPHLTKLEREQTKLETDVVTREELQRLTGSPSMAAALDEGAPGVDAQTKNVEPPAKKQDRAPRRGRR